MRYFALILAVLLPQAISAQNLTKAEEGKVAIANCYAECSRQAHDSVRWTRFEASFNLGPYADKERRLRACIEYQEHIRVMDTCDKSCLDIVEAYGVKTSHARTRFQRSFVYQRAPLQQAGLWVDYKNSPILIGDDPDAFALACNRFADIVKDWYADALDSAQFHESPEPFMVNDIPATEFNPVEFDEILSAGE